MAEIDLDAMAAARAEAMGKPHVVKFKGERFELPPEPAFEIAEHLSDLLFAEQAKNDALMVQAAVGIFRDLLGDEEFDRFRALKPTFQDIVALAQTVLPLYDFGEGAGESEASSDSSGSTSDRSRRTSSGPTGSTSGSASGAKGARKAKAASASAGSGR